MNESLCYRIYNNLNMSLLVNKLMTASSVLSRFDQSLRSNSVLVNYFSNIIYDDENIINQVEKKGIRICDNYFNILMDFTISNNLSKEILYNTFETLFFDEIKKKKKYLRDTVLFETDTKYNTKYITYVYPSKEDIDAYLNEMLIFINENNGIHPIIKSGIMYMMLLLIKPFDFSNDTFAEIIIPFYFIHKNFMTTYCGTIFEEVEQKKNEYDEVLKKIYSGNYNDFMLFYLNSLIDSISNHNDVAYLVNNLYIAMERKIDELFNTNKKANILMYLFSNREYSVKEMANNLGISIMQASRYIEILKENKIIEPNDKKRNVTYVMPNLIAIKKGRT